MSMNGAQRTRQMQAIHIEYTRKLRDGILQQLHPDPRVSCHLWATATLCRLISTLKICGDSELNMLRDTLNGKPSKIHTRLRDILARTKKNPDAWVNHAMHHWPNYKRYCEDGKQYTVETIPWIEAYRLLMQEERRAGSADYRKPNWQPIQQRPVTRVSSEQRMLWGE